MSKMDKSMHVKLITNPGAEKTSESADNLKLVTSCLGKRGLKVDAAFAWPKEENTSIARQAVKDGYKIVIAMGGDGAIEAVMRGMIGSKARLGIIPTGTESNIAMSLGIPKDLQAACALIASEHTRKLDMGQVTFGKGKKFVFFEMATIGLSAVVYPDKFSSIKASATTSIQQEKRPKVILTLDDDSKLEVETLLVVVSNTPVIWKNFPAAPDSSLQDGLLDISVYPDFGKDELLRYYAAAMNDGYSGNGKVQHYHARKMKIKAIPKLDVMADEVELGKGTVTIKVRSGALRVIATEKSSSTESPQKDGASAAPVPSDQESVEKLPTSTSQAVRTGSGEKSVIAHKKALLWEKSN